MKTAIITGNAINDDGKLELMENTRQKNDGQDGSHSVSTRWTGKTFPNTNAGCRAITAECKRRNEGVRFA